MKKLNFLFLTKLLVSVFLAFCAFAFVACSDDDDEKKADYFSSPIVGTWDDTNGDTKLILRSDGTFVMGEVTGTYTLVGNDKIKN
ncbi:MAG: hypothetical protein FWF51_12440 [Chitinivibrionia bacterium]|nr:hypothetical protein [Chitinivibrionia bacterium]